MKIAIVGAIDSAIKKDALGGTEIWSYSFSNELTKRGHEVTIFANPESKIEQKLLSITGADKIKDPTTGEISKSLFAYFSIKEMAEVIKNQDQFDLIHFSVYSIQYYLPLFELIKKPIIVTIHGQSLNKSDAEIILPQHKNVGFAIISKSFLENWPKPVSFQVIYNGINISDFPFSTAADNYFFWMSRISPEKGVEDAIKFAEKTGEKLIIAGPIRNQKYFDAEIKPKLNSKIKFVGSLGLKEKVAYYQKAKAFFMPIKWQEPFGLVTAEAMACGTPVIAYNRGAMAEIISDKIDGFVIEPDDIDGLISAAKNLGKIDRKKCREKVERNFTIEKMTDQYLEFYKKVLNI
ncbi:MAG: glycosyltransferase family 4 protein [Candidatus Berkelbacteria bacterium]|nr:glycosyltransferase family 4 protein [Candidatus Berkelbacteria bacterium]